MKKSLGATAAGVVLTTAALVVGAVPAHADPGVNGEGVVKARTQRTKQPNLASQYSWFEPGVTVSLTCSTHGQPVKGFFSFNEPNGGWDNLWYRTPSGDYIPDVDIETHTLQSVTPDCADFDRQNPGFWMN